MPLLLIILFLLAALFIFTKLYRIALAWFVRSRVDHRWETWARAMTAAASLPLAFVSSMFTVSFFSFIARLAAKTFIFSGLDYYLDKISEHEALLLLLFVLLFMARMVPQTIADSKIFAYNLEFSNATLPSEENISR
jgi:hypothetical protein